jgi:ATP-dependent RNA helicase HelY
MNQSPAEMYAAAKARSALKHTTFGEFQDSRPYQLDQFQIDSCLHVQAGNSVLVAAPTSAGKTIVGQFAVYVALAKQSRCFYTTPIKALSNQKFTEFVAEFGAENVGLLTGDNSINGDAAIVVMTTEVLRNMLYEGRDLTDLSHVVMDEVHYLADRNRGAVWEEVIIHLPKHVKVVALSATVSNAEEFGDWLGAVRGETKVVVEEHRPTPLHQHVMAGNELYDLFNKGEVNRELLRISQNEKSNQRFNRGRNRFHSRLTPSRIAVIEELQRNDLLPSITFIFSRAACNDAVNQCLAAGLMLTTREEVLEIRGLVDAAFEDADADELRILGYATWRDALERGIAAHHAGMLPAFKEVVENLFQKGLVKVVFATETLALGINMPARSVVLEKLVKWNGSVHAPITPGEYTQLTGRAGRRGIDFEGHAIVVWHQELDPGMLAGLASNRTYPLKSSFRPSYNMAVNLISEFGVVKSKELLESSFAQFQADRSVVGLATQIKSAQAAVTGYNEAMECHLGDFTEYMNLRRQITDLEKTQSRDNGRARRNEALDFLNNLRRGDVIAIADGRRRSVPYLVLDEARDLSDPRPRVISRSGQPKRIGMSDYLDGTAVLGAMNLPAKFDSRNIKTRKWISENLAKYDRDSRGVKQEKEHTVSEDVELNRLRKALRAHPCHGCDERETHARWHERIHISQRDIHKLEDQISTKTSSIAKEFDRICDVLTHLGYLTGTGSDLSVTPDGQMLGRIYSELDLLTAQSLRAGILDTLDPAALASAVSILVFESRKDDVEPPVLPEGPLGDAIDAMFDIWGEIKDIENQHRLNYMREADAGFIWPIWKWARNQALSKVLRNSDLQPGDFVRWSKQVIDILGQIAVATDKSTLAKSAIQARELINRGVVSW